MFPDYEFPVDARFVRALDRVEGSPAESFQAHRLPRHRSTDASNKSRLESTFLNSYAFSEHEIDGTSSLLQLAFHPWDFPL